MEKQQQEKQQLIDMLKVYEAAWTGEKDLSDAMVQLTAVWPHCFSRSHFTPGHFTGSAWVVDPSAGKVLLTHHRRLDKWLQLGGHSEGETDIREVALREAVEESGLSSSFLTLADQNIFDIDIHPIPQGKGEPDHSHFDLRFLFFADSSKALTISDESHDLSWVELSKLEEYSSEQSMLRMRDKTYAVPGYSA